MYKIKKVFCSILASAAIFGSCNSVENTVICVQLDPLKKVFTEEAYFLENADTAAVAKGETATFQFVVKSSYPIQGLKIEAGALTNGDRQIAATLQAFVGYISAGAARAGLHGAQSKDAMYPVSDLYPDCLQEVASVDLQPLQNQPVWVTYAIPRDAADGNYTATLVFTGKVNGKSFKIKKEVNARVYPVVLPEQTLWVTNWFDTKRGLPKMNGNQPLEPYSDRWYELLTNLAHVMRDHGQNVYMIGDWDELFNIDFDGAQFTFDFTNFDKTIELFIREGGLKRIEGAPVAGHGAGGLDMIHRGLNVHVPKLGNMPFENDKAQLYLTQFLPALYAHLETKGWKNMYIQHICDEPNPEDAHGYVRISELVRKLMPGIPIIDANCLTTPLVDAVDIWVPLLHAIPSGHTFYRERQAAGDEFWFYTCLGPQDNFANRFMEQPLIQTRLLHWLNYRYGATGYLHWGLNVWHWSKTNDAAARWDLPAGDAWIVYPADGKVYSSIRLAAMRDGIADYELLKLLEQKSPGKARRVAGEIIKDYDRYNNNIRAFRLARQKLLEELSE